MQYACANISFIDYKHLIDIWVKFKPTLHHPRAISNFFRVHGQKKCSRTFQGHQGSVGRIWLTGKSLTKLGVNSRVNWEEFVRCQVRVNYIY